MSCSYQLPFHLPIELTLLVFAIRIDLMCASWMEEFENPENFKFHVKVSLLIYADLKALLKRGNCYGPRWDSPAGRAVANRN